MSKAGLETNRVVSAFAEARAAGKKLLLPFITGGYPDLKATEAILAEFQARGVKVCEIGFPYSDPVADGPVIQASYTHALAKGVTSEGIFEAVRGYRDGGGTMGLLAMVSYAIIFRHGVAEYFAAAAKAGFDGFIVPDLPLDEAGQIEALARRQNLANVMLIAPTTGADRRERIASHATGFIYYVSIAGITGERTTLPAATAEAVAALRSKTATPVCVGFGISGPEAVAQVCKVADGAIVGSAIVRRLAEHEAMPAGKLAKVAGDFVSELLAPIA